MASGTITMAARRSSAMGPSVRNLLSHYNLDPKIIASSGPHQILLKSDVLNYINQNNIRPVDHGNITEFKSTTEKAREFKSDLDLSGHQHKSGPEGYSKIAKELLNM